LSPITPTVNIKLFCGPKVRVVGLGDNKLVMVDVHVIMSLLMVWIAVFINRARKILRMIKETMPPEAVLY
jgi:hypothetical protein